VQASSKGLWGIRPARDSIAAANRARSIRSLERLDHPAPVLGHADRDATLVIVGHLNRPPCGHDLTALGIFDAVGELDALGPNLRSSNADPQPLVEQDRGLVGATGLGQDDADRLEILPVPQAKMLQVLDATLFHEGERAGVVDVALCIDVAVTDGALEQGVEGRGWGPPTSRCAQLPPARKAAHRPSPVRSPRASLAKPGLNEEVGAHPGHHRRSIRDCQGGERIEGHNHIPERDGKRDAIHF